MYVAEGSETRSWTCTPGECACAGTRCSEYTLTSITVTDPEEATFMCPTVSDCRYMDTVTYERKDGGQMGAFEIAITGISG